MILQSELFDPRRNNFTIVRFVLASSVIYTHSFWLIRGIDGQDDLSFILGAPISAYAVDGFFFLSGFLVYPSLLRLGAVHRFLMARLTRLWPALSLCVLLTVLGGIFVTSAPPGRYFSGDTLRFIFGNLSFVSGGYFLTGVDCGGAPCNVNGSLWTLPWEARCYLLLAIFGLVGLAKPKMMARLVLPATLAGALIWDVPAVQSVAKSVAGAGAVYNFNMIDRLWPLFALGIAASIFREKIRLSWLVLIFLFAADIAAHRLGIGLHVRALFVGYAVLCFGFLTAKNGALSGAWPDYSYGMYIYAFPIMMLVQHMFGFQNHLALAAVNLVATVPVAALSWHFLEKPALDRFRHSRSRAVPQPLLQP